MSFLFGRGLGGIAGIGLLIGSLLSLESLADVTNVGYGASSTNIQAAIDNASAGDTVHVTAGTYVTNVTITKRVILEGEGSGESGTVFRSVPAAAASLNRARYGVIDIRAGGDSEADRLVIRNLRLMATNQAGLAVGQASNAHARVSVSYITIDNVKVLGSNLVSGATATNFTGFHVSPSSTVSSLLVTNCAFHNLSFGAAFLKYSNLRFANTGVVANVVFADTEFVSNSIAGLYAEKLQDASFVNCRFLNNGNTNRMDRKVWSQMSGVDLNLQTGSYANITFDRCVIAGNGITSNSAEGAGLSLRARGTGLDAASLLSVVSNVTITGCTITNNERGIRVGEPDKFNLGPFAVVVTNCAIYANTQTFTTSAVGSLYGALAVHSRAPVECSGNYWATNYLRKPVKGAIACVSFFTDEARTTALAVNPADYATLWVDDDFTAATAGWMSSNYAAINPALASAYRWGETLQVAAGQYRENVVIRDPVTISGAGTGVTDTVVLAQPAKAAFEIWGSGLSKELPILLRNMRVVQTNIGTQYTIQIDTKAPYAHVKFDTLYVTGTNQFSENVIGLNMAGATAANPSHFKEFLVTNCAFNNLGFGWYFVKGATAADTGLFYNVEVVDTQFNHNLVKGVYAEKLANAEFRNCEFKDNAYVYSAGGGKFGVGVDVNLKNGAYSNLSFIGCAISGNATNGNSAEGIGLVIKARNDAPSYNAYPATLTNVLVQDCLITGNERGLGIGEPPNKNPASVTGVTLADNRMYGNYQAFTGTTGSAYGDFVNRSLVPPSISGAWCNEPYPEFAAIFKGVYDLPMYYRDEAMTQPVYMKAWVDDDFTGATPGWGATHFASIGAALNAVGKGAEVSVAPGFYTNAVVVRRVSLVGSGSDPAGTVIRPGPLSSYEEGVLRLEASGYSMDAVLALQNLRLEPSNCVGIAVGHGASPTNVSFLFLNDVRVAGSGADALGRERGLHVTPHSDLTWFMATNCLFEDLAYGWYLDKQSTPLAGNASAIRVGQAIDSSFIHNRNKGVYAEKLSDFEFLRCAFISNGWWSGAAEGRGVDINLKAGAYSNLYFTACLILSNGLGNCREGAGLVIRARDDGPVYGAAPATLTNVVVTECTIQGNERGVVLGEPGATNGTPVGVNLYQNAIAGNLKTYTGSDGSTVGDLVNHSRSQAIAVGNYWGSPNPDLDTLISGDVVAHWYFEDPGFTITGYLPPWIQAVAATAGPGLRFSFLTHPVRSYHIESVTTLTPPLDWADELVAVTNGEPGGVLTVEVPTAGSQKFYRLIREDPLP